MRYGEDVIDNVRSLSDIVEIVSGVTQLKKSGSSLVGLCPFHNEKSNYFTVNVEKQF